MCILNILFCFETNKMVCSLSHINCKNENSCSTCAMSDPFTLPVRVRQWEDPESSWIILFFFAERDGSLGHLEQWGGQNTLWSHSTLKKRPICWPHFASSPCCTHTTTATDTRMLWDWEHHLQSTEGEVCVIWRGHQRRVCFSPLITLK